MTDVQPDSAAADFLRRWEPRGPWVLTSISPDRRRIATATFKLDDDDRLASWLETYNGERNIYFHVNRVRHDLTKKAERGDIAEVAWLHVDIDPRAGEDIEAEQRRALGLLTERLPKGVPPPTVIVFSGGGYQGFWRLRTPIPVNGDPALADNAASYNKALETLFGADACHNVDRLMRLPGTMNLPDERKARKGRKPALAKLLQFSDVAYRLDEMPPPLHATNDASPTPRTAIGAAEWVPDLHAFVAKHGLPERVGVILNHGRVPDETKLGDDSRSAWLFEATCAMARAKVPAELMVGILLDPAFGISESVLDKGRKAEAYARRQIERAIRVAEVPADLERNDKGVPYASQRNIRAVLHLLGAQVSHDRFANRLLVEGVEGCGPVLDDAALSRLFLLADEKHGLRPTKDRFWMVVEDEARRAGFHPVLDYLAALRWDGEPRIDRWLSTYGGAVATDYTRAVGAMLLVAAARRIRSPGCKFDEMVVLEGDQGTNKSSALRVLAVEEEWFSDDLPLNAESKVVVERLSGRWIVEAAELKGMRQGAVESLKAFLSRAVDRARPAYGRMIQEVQRQCVIVGTTNSDRYLRDGTGNRRFWPVRIERFDLAALRRDRDQLWAEAAAREADGGDIRLPEDLWGIAAEQQEERRAEDPWVPLLRDALEDSTGKVRALDLWAVLDMPAGQRTQDHNFRLGEAMKELGWQRTKARFGGRQPEWAYARGDDHRRVVFAQHGDRWRADFGDAMRRAPF